MRHRKWAEGSEWCDRGIYNGQCHDRDRTYPYTPYPNLSTPIPSHLNHSWAPNTKPKPLTPSCLSNTLPNTLTPLRLVNAFPTRHTFDLSSPSRQVDSRHPHPFLTRCSVVPSRQGPTQSNGRTKASDALPNSRANVPIFGQSLLAVPDRTCTVTYWDHMALLRLALCSPNSLCSRELAKYKIQYL